MTPERPVVFAFASFVFDPENGRLSHNGVPVRVNNQIIELLELLIVNAGELVTREQIRLSLWPDQAFVNHEKIITNAISRLRHILRDDPANPRYIESVPKRGYRLVVEVHQTYATPEPLATELLLPTVFNPLELPSPTRPLTPARITPLTTRFWRSSATRIYIAYGGLAFVVIGLLAWRWNATHRAPPINAEISLGVAPFEVSGTGAKELAESFRVDLTDSLSQLPHVKVRAAHSLELFSLDGATFRERANKLGLDALLIGRFTLAGNDCHIELELVRGNDLAHIATYRYNVSRAELANVRDTIQRETFRSLKLAGGKQNVPPAAIGGTSNPQAYDAYLRAGYHLSQQTSDSLRLALNEYQEATTLDPHFAKAYAHEARTYFYLEQNSLISDEEGFRLCGDAARKALALDPSSAEAHADLGILYFLHDWNFSAGEDELRQAIASDPNQPFFHQGLALLFNDEGRFREAFSEIDLAHANDPFWVSAYVTEAHVASVAKDMPRVVSSTRRLMDLVPDSPHGRDAIGNAEWNIGHFLDAIATWRSMAVMEHDPDRVATEDAGLEAFHKNGVPGYAHVRLAAIASGKGVQLHNNDFVPAEWYSLAGETTQALAAIRAGVDKRDSDMLSIGVLPAYDSLRNNPEFKAILRTQGLGPSTHK
jgi:DNA-binding winged helix-turn-helix (wHTH) protein/tetratricopeptide (TPR) repeat protein